MRDVIDYKLPLVGLAGFEDFYPREISGGMRNAPALARAIALDPEMLFFDEPSAGLDPISSQLPRRIDSCRSATLGATVVIVTHELASIFTYRHNSVFLDADTKTQARLGDPNHLLTASAHAKVRRFLGRGVEVGTTSGEALP